MAQFFVKVSCDGWSRSGGGGGEKIGSIGNGSSKKCFYGACLSAGRPPSQTLSQRLARRHSCKPSSTNARTHSKYQRPNLKPRCPEEDAQAASSHPKAYLQSCFDSAGALLKTPVSLTVPSLVSECGFVLRVLLCLSGSCCHERRCITKGQFVACQYTVYVLLEVTSQYRCLVCLPAATQWLVPRIPKSQALDGLGPTTLSQP